MNSEWWLCTRSYQVSKDPAIKDWEKLVEFHSPYSIVIQSKLPGGFEFEVFGGYYEMYGAKGFELIEFVCTSPWSFSREIYKSIPIIIWSFWHDEKSVLIDFREDLETVKETRDLPLRKNSDLLDAIQKEFRRIHV